MANIKLKNILKDAFPLDKCWIVTDYYLSMGRKNSRKYLDKWDKIFETKWEIVTELGLDNTLKKRQNILDIGAGPHIFAWLAVKLGHWVETTELPLDNDFVERDNIQWFKDITKAIGIANHVPQHDWVITHNTKDFPVSLQKQWDIITIQRSNFDIGWDVEDYSKFISLCLRHTNIIYYEVAREQYQSLVNYCITRLLNFEHSIQDTGQGKVVIYNK